MNENELYERAIAKWGNIAQIDKAIEECAELIVALAKITNFKNGSTCNQVLEEMVDVEIMITQLKLIFNHSFQLILPTSKFHEIKQAKLKRLEERLK